MSTQRTANAGLIVWGILTLALIIGMPEPSTRDPSWLDTAFLALVASVLGTANIKLAYGSINMSGAAVCAAIATVSPLQAALVGFTGQLIHSWERRHTDLVPSNVGQAFWGAFGASIRVLCLRLGAPTAASISIALLAAILANVLSTAIALSLFHATPALGIVRQAVSASLAGAYAYFVIAGSLASTMLNGTYGGILRASGVFALVVAVGDSVGGRSIRDFLERQLVAAEPHVKYSHLAQETFHDLRNLVATAIIHLQEIDRVGLPAQQHESISIALAALHDARGVLVSAQATGRMSGQSQFVKVDLSELCDRTAALHRPVAAQRGIGLAVRAKGGDYRVFGHPVLLSEVLSNLILNSVDATPAGGMITVECRGGNQLATITVTDTGPGISNRIGSRIFEPGFTTKTGTGSGLGLYTALGIARQHHGDLELVPTADGTGACFRLTVPSFPVGKRALGGPLGD